MSIGLAVPRFWPAHRANVVDWIEKQQILHIRVDAKRGRHKVLRACQSTGRASVGGGFVICRRNFAHEIFFQKPAEKGSKITPDLLDAGSIKCAGKPVHFGFRLARLDPGPSDGADLVAAVVISRFQIHDDEFAIDDLADDGWRVNQKQAIHGLSPLRCRRTILRINPESPIPKRR